MLRQEQNAEEITPALPQSFSTAVGNHTRQNPNQGTSDANLIDASESRADEAKIEIEGAGQRVPSGEQDIGRFQDFAKPVQPKNDEQREISFLVLSTTYVCTFWQLSQYLRISVDKFNFGASFSVMVRWLNEKHDKYKSWPWITVFHIPKFPSKPVQVRIKECGEVAKPAPYSFSMWQSWRTFRWSRITLVD